MTPAPLPPSPQDETPTDACAHCGAALSGLRYQRLVTCTYCQHAQPNVACVAPGEEVMCRHAIPGYSQLARVVACRGPDEIELRASPRNESSDAFIRALEDLIPVARAPADLGAGTAVFAREMVGWVRTWTASELVQGELTVKNSAAAFQSAFFDKRIVSDDLRVPSRASDQGKRTGLSRALASFRADPLGAVFDLFFSAIRAFFVLVFAGIALFIAYSLLRR